MYFIFAMTCSLGPKFVTGLGPLINHWLSFTLCVNTVKINKLIESLVTWSIKSSLRHLLSLGLTQRSVLERQRMFS